MTVHKCDRCEDIFTELEGCSIVHPTQPGRKLIELCNACKESFVRWLASPERTFWTIVK